MNRSTLGYDDAHKSFLLITAFVTGTIGVTLLIFPAFIVTLFLSEAAHNSDIFIRFLGSALIGYSYLNWHTAMHNALSEMPATLLSNLSTLCIALVISILGVLDGTLKSTGIFIILLHAIFAFGFGFFSTKIRSKSH